MVRENQLTTIDDVTDYVKAGGPGDHRRDPGC
ncbi:MAG: hypothetical protein P8X80_05925 [Desulfobacterales bacterium]